MAHSLREAEVALTAIVEQHRLKRVCRGRDNAQMEAFLLLIVVAVVAYLAWAYRTNHYDEHGCRIEYLYTDQAHVKRYARSQVGRDIPREIAEWHPDHIYDRPDD